MNTLHYHNSPLIMSQCGSKGSPINIAQMVACVGQQSGAPAPPPARPGRPGRCYSPCEGQDACSCNSALHAGLPMPSTLPPPLTPRLRPCRRSGRQARAQRIQGPHAAALSAR